MKSQSTEKKEIEETVQIKVYTEENATQSKEYARSFEDRTQLSRGHTGYQSDVSLSSKRSSYNQGTLPTVASAPELQQTGKGKDIYGDIPVLDSFHSDEDEEEDEEDEGLAAVDPDDVVPVLENGDFTAESDSDRKVIVSSHLRTYVRARDLASSSSPTLSAAGLYNAEPKPLSADNLPRSQHDFKKSWTSSQLSSFASNTSGRIVQDMGINSKSSSRNIERQLVRKGWLLKQGNVWRSWKRRFFVLIKRINKTTGQQFASLQYYKGSKFSKLRGEINLSEEPLIVRFLDASETKRPFCFEVTRGIFSIICQAADEEDVSAWVCHLQSLADAANDSGSRRGSRTHLITSRIGKGGTTDEKSIRIIAELRRLLHNSKSPEAMKLKNYVKSFEFRVQQPLQQLKKFHNSLTESIFQDHSSRILALLEGPNETNMSRAVLEEDIRESISRHVEEALYLPLQDGIQSYIRRMYHEDDVLLNRKLRWLQGKDQTYFNIPLHHISLKDWRQAQRVLVQITNHNLPAAKFDILLETLEEIQACYAQEHSNGVTVRSHKRDSSLSSESGTSSSSQTTGHGLSDQEQKSSAECVIPPLEIDDIVPIFTFVLTHTGLENLITMKTVLTELNCLWNSTNNTTNGGSSVTSSTANSSIGTLSTSSTVLSSSAIGAAISVFTDALDFISNVSVPAALEDIFKDQLTLSIDGEWRRVLDFEVEPTYRYGAVIQHISFHGHSAFGSSVSRGSVLVTINGQNVVLWPYADIVKLLQLSSPPHRFAFIPNSSYFKILTSNKSLWNLALMHACQRGDLGSVQMLLANGADVNYVANECAGNTPLHVAVSALHFNVVSYILQHGARAKTLGEFGRNALHMVGVPCSMPSSTSSDTSKSKSSASIHSTSFGTKSMSGKQKSSASEPWLQDRPVDKVVLIVKKLISHGIQLDAVDMYGNTPIMLLAENGLLHGIDVLMEANGEIDLDQRNWVGGISALSYSAREGHYDVVEALLDYGAIPDVRTLQGETPLHFAAGIANKKICEILLEQGAEVDARTQKGITPLMMAVSKGAARFSCTSRSDKEKKIQIDESSFIETIDFLLEKGAEKESVCCLYRLPIHYAALYGGPIIFEHLMEKIGLNVSVRDLFGKTALAMVEDDAESRADRESQEKVARLVESRSSILDAQLFEQEKADDKRYKDELLMDKKEDGSGVLEVVAGTFDALLMGLIRFEHYRVEDVQAFIWSCDSYASPIRVVEFLKQTLKVYENTSNAQFVRRMVLHAIDAMAEKLKHQTKVDEETSNELRAFCGKLFPFNISEDPQCAQWLSASSLLYDFIESPDDFFTVSYCERDYISLKSLLGTMHDKSPTLNFLDDELFTTGGIQVISEQMRRRLSIAGVWNDDSSKSYVVKQAVRKQSASKSPPTSSKSRANLRSAGSSTTAVDVFSASVSASVSGLPLSLTGSFRTRPSPATSESSSSDRVRLWIHEMNYSTTAQQITLLQHYFFSRIKISEVLANKKNAQHTPDYDRLRQLHNHVSVWVASEILSRDNVDQRAFLLSYFIQVANVCLNPLQNFDGFMAVMNALNDSSIFRLKKTWGRLTPQTRDLFHDLKKLTENGARPVHRLMKEASPPCMPYLGLILQNIIGLKEYPDYFENKLINFKKIRSLGSLIQMMLPCQKTPYLLATDSSVLDRLCSIPGYPDTNACFQRSLKVEPRINPGQRR